MNRGITTAIVLAVVGGGALNLALYSIAHAGGPGEIAAIAAFNPLDWPWMDILVVALTALGAIAGVLRVLSPMTKTTADDKLLGWVDWLAAFLARIVVPGKYKAALAQVEKELSLGGGKGGIGDQPSPPLTGGKPGGGAQ